MLGPAPAYWLVTLVVTVACNLPYMVHNSYQRLLYPLDHHVIQEIKHFKKDVEDQRMWTREKSKARQCTKIGFSARVEERIRIIKRAGCIGKPGTFSTQLVRSPPSPPPS